MFYSESDKWVKINFPSCTFLEVRQTSMHSSKPDKRKFEYLHILACHHPPVRGCNTVDTILRLLKLFSHTKQRFEFSNKSLVIEKGLQLNSFLERS